jgi:hypothetical protein
VALTLLVLGTSRMSASPDIIECPKVSDWEWRRRTEEKDEVDGENHESSGGA